MPGSWCRSRPANIRAGIWSSRRRCAGRSGEAEVELAALLAGQTGAALERARALRALQGRSATDTVTGLYSRWYFYERLYAEVARARRYRQPLSLVVGELDGEEDLARARGPAFRDAVLAAMARLLLTSLRDKVDVACRLGGGRFALLLPSTPPGTGRRRARRRPRAAAGRRHAPVRRRAGRAGPLHHEPRRGGVPGGRRGRGRAGGRGGGPARAARAAGGDRIEPPLPEPDEEDEAPEDEPA